MNSDKTTCKYINNVIKNNCKGFWYKRTDLDPWAFCVHTSIFKNLQNSLRKASIILPESGMFEYELQINGKCFDMIFITVPPGNKKNDLFLHSIITSSQVSFAWQDNPNIFIDEDSFHILQEFIAEHNLESYILETNKQPAISTNKEKIIEVTFDQTVNNGFDIIEKYEIYLSSNEKYDRPTYIYLIHPLPWMQPQFLEYFKIPLDDNINVIILIIIQHLETLKYASELNIFELLNLRLALCDYHNPVPTSIVKYEIDFMIKRKLAKIIKNNHLDLSQYSFKAINTHRSVLNDYLIYEFQNLFKTVKYSHGRPSVETEGPGGVGVINLDRESDVLTTLKWNRNLYFEIIGQNYDKMSLSLFLDLIEYDNVTTIHFDTDYTFIRDLCKLDRVIANEIGIVNIYFEGNNALNFIDDFVSSFKTVTLSKGIFHLYFDSRLYFDSSQIDFTIFDNLSNVVLYFRYIQITKHLLNGLHQCALKSFFYFSNCTLENTSQSWELIYNLMKINIKEVEIFEDEDTWQSLYEFVSHELIKSNSKEFRFNFKNLKISCNERRVNLTKIKFAIDEFNTKLELYDTSNNKKVDLYDLKFGLESDDCNTDYDFYN